MSHAKILFEQVGSVGASSAGADSFINFTTMYLEARYILVQLDLLKSMIESEGRLASFTCVGFTTENCKDADGNKYNPSKSVVTGFERYFIGSSDRLRWTFENQKITVAKIEKWKKTILNKDELDVFNQVNNYEKLKLNAALGQTKKSVLKSKI